MKILTRSQEIRAAIRELLSDPTDERIVVVGFVGADAKSYVPQPKGLRIYCWPKAGGTNPYAVEELRRLGSDVCFVDGLHAKVYWSRKYGAVVGSANLTNNALGEGGLREYAIRLAPRTLDVRPFVRTLNVIGDFDTALKNLYVAHVRFMQRNLPVGRSDTAIKRLPLFKDWLKRKNSAEEWRLGWYEEDSAAPTDAVKMLREATGSPSYVRFLGVSSRNNLSNGVPTLGCKIRQQTDRVRLSSLEWWVPEYYAQTAVAAWRDYPHVWFAQRSRLPTGTRPPFDCHEPRFKSALMAAINDRNSVEDTPVKVQGKFLATLARHYQDLRESP